MIPDPLIYIKVSTHPAIKAGFLLSHPDENVNFAIIASLFNEELCSHKISVYIVHYKDKK